MKSIFYQKYDAKIYQEWPKSTHPSKMREMHFVQDDEDGEIYERGVYPIRDIRLATEEASFFKQVREPKSRVNGPRRILFDSLKAKRFSEHYAVFILEGRAEGRATFLFEFSTHIKFYKPQPFTLRFHFQNRTHHYTPDFIIYYHDGRPPDLCEIKPSLQFEDPEVKSRLDFVAGQCAEHGIGFIRISAEETERRPRLDTMEFLYPFAFMNPERTHSLREILKSAKRPLPLEAILKADQTITPADVAVSLVSGAVETSYKLPWGPFFNLSLGPRL